jgi:hypothetical protein
VIRNVEIVQEAIINLKLVNPFAFHVFRKYFVAALFDNCCIVLLYCNSNSLFFVSFSALVCTHTAYFTEANIKT